MPAAKFATTLPGCIRMLRILIKNSNRLDMSIDPFTGGNPSYCFVELASEHEASRAMKILAGKLCRGRPIKINLNTPKRGGGGGPIRSARAPTQFYDRMRRPEQLPAKDAGEEAYVFDRWKRTDAPQHWIDPPQEGRRLYVGGLPRIPNQDACNLEMRELFAGYEIQAVSKIVAPHPSTQDKPGSYHYCFVDLPSAAEAACAAEALDGKPTESGGSYRINIARDKLRKVIREQFPDRDTTKPKDFSSDWRTRS